MHFFVFYILISLETVLECFFSPHTLVVYSFIEPYVQTAMHITCVKESGYCVPKVQGVLYLAMLFYVYIIVKLCEVIP